MAKSNKKRKEEKTIRASVPTERSASTTPRRKKKKKIDIKRYLMIGFIGLAMVSFIFTSLPSGTLGGGKTKRSNSSASSPAAVPAAPAAVPTFKEEGSLSFKKADGTAIRSIKLEVADDEPQRNQGMMYRKSIPNDTGMIFLFPDVAPRSFWMKNTYVSLDIIFVGADKKIINIHENTATLTEQNFPSTAPAKYVVEVAGGYTNAYGIKAGDLIDFEVR
ncbi:MAG: uncharacterized membrane protein (UPF0127 family) [Polaribacter sp.]|jgi:uncharacterized membrane protein (UPF0127 family)